MKRLIALLLAALICLCSCSGASKYEKALDEALSEQAFTVTVENSMTVTTDEGEDVYNDTVHYAQGNGIISAKLSGDSGYSEYYHKDGNIYFVSEAGSYYWQAESNEIFSLFCYVKPLEYTFEECEKKDGVLSYSAQLNGEEYEQTLLGANPAFDDFGITEAEFTSFTYSATVEDDAITSYTYDFSFDAVSGSESAKITNVMKITYEQTEDVTMPKGYESFVNSGGNISDLSEEAFTQEVMLIIVEALYNSDGTRKDDFDKTYAEFVAMYGEETMSTFIGGIEEFNASIGIGQ